MGEEDSSMAMEVHITLVIGNTAKRKVKARKSTKMELSMKDLGRKD